MHYHESNTSYTWVDEAQQHSHHESLNYKSTHIVHVSVVTKGKRIERKRKMCTHHVHMKPIVTLRSWKLGLWIVKWLPERLVWLPIIWVSQPDECPKLFNVGTGLTDKLRRNFIQLRLFQSGQPIIACQKTLMITDIVSPDSSSLPSTVCQFIHSSSID